MKLTLLTCKGTSIQSSRFLLANLKKNAWLDNGTFLAFFEQSYWNNNIRTFLQLRLRQDFLKFSSRLIPIMEAPVPHVRAG